MPDQPVIEGSNGTPDQVVLNFLADMKAAELWAFQQTINDDEWDLPAIRERYFRVRQRYLTAQRAADRNFGVAFGDTPFHDPDKTRVVEMTARRRDPDVATFELRIGDYCEQPRENLAKAFGDHVHYVWSGAGVVYGSMLDPSGESP